MCKLKQYFEPTPITSDRKYDNKNIACLTFPQRLYVLLTREMNILNADYHRKGVKN